MNLIKPEIFRTIRIIRSVRRYEKVFGGNFQLYRGVASDKCYTCSFREMNLIKSEIFRTIRIIRSVRRYEKVFGGNFQCS